MTVEAAAAAEGGEETATETGIVREIAIETEIETETVETIEKEIAKEEIETVRGQGDEIAEGLETKGQSDGNVVTETDILRMVLMWAREAMGVMVGKPPPDSLTAETGAIEGAKTNGDGFAELFRGEGEGWLFGFAFGFTFD